MRFRKCVGTFLLMGLLAACGGRTEGGGFHPSGRAPADGSSAGPPGSSAGGVDAVDGNPGVGTPAPKAPQSALAAYRAYQLAYEKAYRTNDASVLNPVAMDPLLATVAKDIASVRADGLIWRFHNAINPHVQGKSTDGATVVILDCLKTLGSYKFDAKTGRRMGTWRGGDSEYQATMRYSSGIWKISEATEGGKC
ncbi:hypothetical protein [Actinomadura sp. DC4]|uniref:hypothetical protein n=1 Tax=Actinomadura sp. DC4 TaxID=3055069 RepID=UPI0025B09D84|nr:hypothetical protein [Actinomadura sp. DC4]MDN3352671.1 hypothetical protein [Actinomadura sp. DC4]